jgi:hypothetical protein
MNQERGASTMPEKELEMQDETNTKVLLLAKNVHPNDADDLEKGGGAKSATLLLMFTQVHQLVDNVHEYSLLDTKRNRLLIYIFLLLIYIGLNVALLGANFQEQKFIEENYYISFHMVAFWGVFGFTTLEALVLIATDYVSWNSRLQVALLLFNVMMSFATAVLFSFDPKLYEAPAHFMEYSIQVLISAMNMIFVNTYIRAASSTSMVYRFRYLEYVVLTLVLALSLFQLSVYAGAPRVEMGAERAAHFAEFTNEIFNGLFALLYAILSYTDVRNQLQDHYLKMKAPYVTKYGS